MAVTSDGIIFGISIHAPREGRDVFAFLVAVGLLISIHAPREGRDTSEKSALRTTLYFNPRAPRGARLQLFTVLGLR